MHSMDSPTSASGIPAFLVKLWRLVEDETTDHVISWNESGNGFTVKNQSFFSKEILPLFFKHNNMASFVRQLNMYGFRKLLSLESGGLKPDKDEIEFAHPYFLKNCYFLLENIKRKIPSSRDDSKLKVEVMSKALSGVQLLKSKQDTFDTKLNRMKKENEALWREIANLREKHVKQQQILNRLIQFLVTIVQSNRTLGVKRAYPLMLDEVSHSSNPKRKATHRNSNAVKVEAQSLIHDVTDSMEEIDDSNLPGGSSSTASVISMPPSDNLGIVTDPDGKLCTDGSIPNTISVPIYTYSLDGNSVGKPEVVQIVTDSTGETDEGVPISIDESGDIKAFGKQLVNSTGDLKTDCSPITNPLVHILMAPDGAGEKSVDEKTVIKTEGKKAKNSVDLQVALNNNSKVDPDNMGLQEMGNHLESIQLNLDGLKDLLSYPCYGIDSNTLVGVSKGGGNLDHILQLFDGTDITSSTDGTDNVALPITSQDQNDSSITNFDGDQCQLFPSLSPVMPPDEEQNIFSPLMMNHNSDFEISDSSYINSPDSILPSDANDDTYSGILETPKYEVQELEFPSKKPLKKGKGKKKKVI